MANRNLSADFLLAQAYVGAALPEENYDCAHFFLQVQREVFGNLLSVPHKFEKHKRGAAGRAVQIRAARDELAIRLDQPLHGCAALLVTRTETGGRWHIGTVFEFNGEFWILHTSRVTSGAALNRLRDFAWRGQSIEGYYLCK